MLDINDFKLGKKIKIKHGNSSIKSLINIIKKYNYNESDHKLLLAMDAFTNDLIEESPKIFDINYKSMSPIDLQVHKLMLKINMMYFIEKYLVYESSSGVRGILANDIVKSSNIISTQSSFNKENLLNEVFFYLSYEQFTLQDYRFTNDYYRIVNMFQSSEDALNIIEKEFKLPLFKMISLHHFLVIWIFNEKAPSVRFSISRFKKSVLESIRNVTERELDIFLDNLLISHDKFKDIHCNFRYKKDSKGKVLLDKNNKPINMSWEEQSPIDRSFPKISYSFPLLSTNDNKHMILTSYTALRESLKLERYIREITSIPRFKSDYYGPLLEEYIKILFCDYYKDNQIEVKIYGDEVYTIGKNEYKAPDVIIENDQYVIFIESKTSAFNLEKALKNFSTEEHEKYFKDIEKSSKNINRYLDVNTELKEKKIYKFVSFIAPQSAMVSALPDKISEYNISDDLIITDLNSLEALVNLNNKDIVSVLNAFIKDDIHRTLYHFCQSEYEINISKYDKFYDKHKVLDFYK